MDSEALIWPQFTQIDNYDSLIVEIKFPVQLGPNLEEAARNHLDSRRLADNAKVFSAKPIKIPVLIPDSRE
jgi:hypothetical protein